MIRLSRSASLIVLLLTLGCSEIDPTSLERVTVAGGGLLPSAFPPRTDRLVVTAPTVAPTGPEIGSGFPLDALDRAPSTTGDVAALESAANSKQILDPRQLDLEPREELTKLLNKTFGSPSEPKIVGLDAETTQALRLEPADLAAGARLFARHCALCHGDNGNGRGPAAGSYHPHPRDFRQGRFKFLSADLPLGEARPRRDDLDRTLIQGIPASGMPSFAMLSPRARQQLVSYVTYLSLRGECEYGLLRGLLTDQLDPEDPEGLAEEMAFRLKAVAGYWRKSEQTPVVPDLDPYVTDEAKLLAAVEGQKHVTALCTRCHINYGKGPFYLWDDWGTVVRPRNLYDGQYRGGRRGLDLYYRVHVGIAGSNMPGFAKELKPTPAEQSAGVNRLWQVVHFLEMLSDEAGRARLRNAGVELE